MATPADLQFVRRGDNSERYAKCVKVFFPAPNLIRFGGAEFEEVASAFCFSNKIECTVVMFEYRPVWIVLTASVASTTLVYIQAASAFPVQVHLKGLAPSW